MAHTDGFDLLKRIRPSSDPAIREVPAVALTAYARAEDGLAERFPDAPGQTVDPAELIVAVASLAKHAAPQPE